jgi:hypothetical protein
MSSPWQLLALVHGARSAKEKLLSDEAVQEVPIAVPSRGSSLFAKTLSTALSREEVVSLLVDGYFPLTVASELPAQRKSVGLQEYGLDYATEPAVSKHLARFLRRSLENVKSDERLAALIGHPEHLERATLLRPTAVLFNGGVFEAAIFRRRIVELLQSWFEPAAELKELKSAGLDIAAPGAHTTAVQVWQWRSNCAGTSAPTIRPGSMPAVPGYVLPVGHLDRAGTEEGPRSSCRTDSPAWSRRVSGVPLFSLRRAGDRRDPCRQRDSLPG